LSSPYRAAWCPISTADAAFIQERKLPVEICGSMPLEARHTCDPDGTLDSPFHRDVMTPVERLDELARLLALGYLRLSARRQQEKAMNRTT
jgi:hypothetical protein